MSNFLRQLFGLNTQAGAAPAEDAFSATIAAAQLAVEQRQWDEAVRLYQEGLRQAQSQRDLRAEQYFFSGIGNVRYRQRNYEAAREQFRQAIMIAKRLQDPLLLARSNINLGETFAAEKQWGQAQTYHEKALAFAQQSGDKATRVLALENLARCYLEQNNAAYAIHLLRDGVNQAQAAKDPMVGASVLGWLGRAHLRAGERATGRKLLEQAQRLAMQVGRENLALQWVVSLAKLDLEEGAFREALERFQAAEALSRRVPQQSQEFYLDLAIAQAQAYHQIGEYDLAQQQADRALMHARELEDPSGRAGAAQVMGLALQGKGYHQEALQYLQETLAAHDAGILTEESGRVALLLAIGKSQMRLGQQEAAQAHFEAARNAAQKLGLRVQEAEALHLLGTVKNNQLDRREAIRLWMQAIRLFEDEGKSAAAARALCDLGNVRRLMGDLGAATKDFENASVLLSNVDDQVTRGLVLSNAANLYTQLGDVETAEAFYTEAINIARSLHDAHSESIRTGNLAWLYVQTGQASRALELFERSLSISRQLNDTLLIAIQSNNKAYALARMGDHPAAKTLYEEVLALPLEAPRWQGIFQSNYGESLVALGDHAAGEAAYQQALEISEALADRENLIRSQHRLAALYLAQGKLAEAQALAAQAYESARKMGYRRGQAEAARVLGDLASAQGNAEAARQYYADSKNQFKIIQDPTEKEIAL